MIEQDEDRLDELPEADIAYDGPVHDTNAQAKRRQTIIWGLLSSVCGVALLWAGYTIIFKSDEPVKTDKAAGERLLATADVVRANDMSPETRASELTVRVQQLDQQIGSLNQGLTSKDAEVQTLTRQLEAERADALRTIDAIQRQSGTRGESGGVPSGGSSQAAGALGGGAAGLQMPGGAPNQTGGFVAGAPQMGPGMDGGAQQPRRTMTTVRVGQGGGAGGAGGGALAMARKMAHRSRGLAALPVLVRQARAGATHRSCQRLDRSMTAKTSCRPMPMSQLGFLSESMSQQA